MNKSDIRKVISKSILADGMSPVIDLKKSHGSWLVDKVTGKEYLDEVITIDNSIYNLFKRMHLRWCG